jgi:hypothetical protein
MWCVCTRSLRTYIVDEESLWYFGDDYCKYVQEVGNKRAFPAALTECQNFLSGVVRSVTR